ncbi:MAG: hypothetical protein AAGI07_01800 [Bacteroidota bacterium]
MKTHAEKLLKNLEVTPLTLPNGLAHLKATFKTQPVNMYSYAWKSEIFRLVRMTILLVPGRIETFNFVLYPNYKFVAPVFASDFVITGTKLRIGMIDWMPIFPDDVDFKANWIMPMEEFYIKALEIAPQYDLKLEWSKHFTSKYACMATDIEEARMPALVNLWEKYLNRYLDKIGTMPPAELSREEEVKTWHHTYNHAHLNVENKRNPYMVYFGEQMGKRYNEEFLFSNDFGN